ncbi:nucleic acid-binding protein [Natronoarchaeum mannanilyticum]|uniref:Nucleic acid-binding protein n=1 Tax=Natronoarchaeum mannanilyticum TaxID=926360 RepID=A0AAV3TBK8_9EURY
MTVVAVTDTGPLIHLSEAGALELLSLPDRLFVPQTVIEELEAGGVPAEFDDLEFNVVTADFDSLPEVDLDPGETAALAIARERDCVLLTDDLDAREQATERGVEVHGSIGVVALGNVRGDLDCDEAATIMRTLQRETSLFVTDAVVERGIELLREQ